MLLCDEITSALDPETTLSILRLLRRITTELNLSVLFITHDMDVIKSVADRVVVMEKGKIVEEADIITLFKNPKSDVATALTESSLHCDLPTQLARQLIPQPDGIQNAIIRIKFCGHPAVEPIIDHLVRQENLTVNIFQANLEYIQQETIGMMIVSTQGQPDDIARGLAFLNQKQCHTELLGYLNESSA